MTYYERLACGLTANAVSLLRNLFYLTQMSQMSQKAGAARLCEFCEICVK